MARVTLSKKDLATTVGRDLLTLLQEITHDGELSIDEINKLKAWLESNTGAATVPAVAWLREILKAMLIDGRISHVERQDILSMIERVLPQSERILAKVRRRAASEMTQTNAPPPDPIFEAPDSCLATGPQLSYLRSLRVSFDAATLTKERASELIDEALAGRAGPSNRQLMVLRFWNRMDLATKERIEISDWMNQWYEDDPIRLEAWEAFKAASGDDGSQGDPKAVPLGAGDDWILRLNAKKLHEYRAATVNDSISSYLSPPNERVSNAAAPPAPEEAVIAPTSRKRGDPQQDGSPWLAVFVVLAIAAGIIYLTS